MDTNEGSQVSLLEITNKFSCEGESGFVYYPSRFVSSYEIMYGGCSNMQERKVDIHGGGTSPFTSEANVPKGRKRALDQDASVETAEKVPRSDIAKEQKKLVSKTNKEGKMQRQRDLVRVPNYREVMSCDKTIYFFLQKVMPQRKADGENITEKDLRWLRMANESYSFITFREDSEAIVKRIGDLALKSGRRIGDLVITDLTAHIGGDVLSFASHFKKVNAVEIDQEIFRYLNNNIDVYGFKNVSTYHSDSIKWIEDTSDVGDIVFVDPPWGGSEYGRNSKLRLFLSGVGVEDVAKTLLQKEAPPMMVVMKLPLNYDTSHLYEKLRGFKVDKVNIRKLLMIFVRNM